MGYRIPFDVPTWDFDESLCQLHAALRFGICPLIETVEDMLAELGDPDLCFDCLQVAGTNGKTSTARYAAAILAGEGLRVALYTSPELVRYPERMEVDGRVVSDEEFAMGIAAATEAGRRVNARREASGERPYDITEFDTLTVAAMVVFAVRGVDAVVLEVGMGGRWDATSAAKSIRSVAVTGIGLDHMRILGDTLEAIAREKAAVIKSGRKCVLGVGTSTPSSVEDVFLERAAAQGVEPVLVRAVDPADVVGIMNAGAQVARDGYTQATFAIEEKPERIGGPLRMSVQTPRARYQGVCARKPAYQSANIACAMVLCEQFLGRALDQRLLLDAVMACPTPGRFDVVRAEPLALVDACHNPQSVHAFLEAVRAVEPDIATRPTLLCAVLADKDVDGIVEQLAAAFPRVVVTRTDSARALAPKDLARFFAEHGNAPRATYPDVSAAVAALAGEPFVACGSITTAGEVAGILRPA